jgi:hypothetical protein
MTPTVADEYEIEPERYELFDTLMGSEWTRREFFRVAGGGIVVALLMNESVRAQQRGGGGGGGAQPQEIGAWVHVGEDGTVTGYTGKVEIGQNIGPHGDGRHHRRPV